MPETIIQHLILPSAENESARPLYVRGYNGSFPIDLSEGKGADFRTFFNFFPSEKYRTYAGLDRILLRLDCDGEPTVVVTRSSREGSESETYRYSGTMQIELKDECLLGIEIKAEDGPVSIRGGVLLTDTEPVNDVHLTHVICTYHREDVVKRKLDSICSVSENDETIKDNLMIYVVDNGQSFEYHNDMVKVIPSGNYGGSGGFSRGMIEAVNDGITTHVTLNDDDALLDPETIFRTLSFYRFIWKDTDPILGGTILEEGRKCTVHEAGAYFSNGWHTFNDGMDPSTIEGCVEVEKGFDGSDEGAYFAWCYMTLSCNLIRKYGYALPLFFQQDDVDYGLRTYGVPKVTMCGISVWHPFVNSYSTNKTYYALRNILIVCAANGQIRLGIMKNICMNMMVNLFCYRYRAVEAQIQAFNDFRKGPKHVFGMIKGNYQRFDEYQYQDSYEGGNITTKIIRHGRFFNLVSMNGLFFPSIGDLEADMSECDVPLFYRKGNAIYRSSDGKAVICRRSRMTSLMLFAKILLNLTVISLRKRKINKIYSDSVKEYSSEDCWRRINDN